MTDLEMMKDSNLWPWWPLLPLERGLQNGVEVGFLLSNGKPIVYMKNMFSLMGGPIAKQLTGVPTKSYDSFEALIADGWVVD